MNDKRSVMSEYKLRETIGNELHQIFCIYLINFELSNDAFNGVIKIYSNINYEFNETIRNIFVKYARLLNIVFETPPLWRNSEYKIFLNKKLIELNTILNSKDISNDDLINQLNELYNSITSVEIL